MVHETWISTRKRWNVENSNTVGNKFMYYPKEIIVIGVRLMTALSIVNWT
jgi:hypothetical protein